MRREKEKKEGTPFLPGEEVAQNEARERGGKRGGRLILTLHTSLSLFKKGEGKKGGFKRRVSTGGERGKKNTQVFLSQNKEEKNSLDWGTKKKGGGGKGRRDFHSFY